MKTSSRACAILLLAAATLGLAVGHSGSASRAAALGQDQGIPSLDGSIGWLNSRPLSVADLKGKVVLVDFWEYTCVNCLKTLPYEKAWYDRYARYGFTIVGVHTPEFKFSGEPRNVAAAVERLGIRWPVALDSNDIIWQRWNNDSWPHEFLFDESGRRVADHSGEGDYPEMEMRIAALVRKNHPGVKLPKLMGYLPADNYSKPGAVCYPRTPEVYAGNWRGDGALGNAQGYQPEVTVQYDDSTQRHQDGRVYLQGSWHSINQALVYDGASTATAKDYIDLRYHAIEVVSVLKPEDGKPVLAYVEQDGKPLPKEEAGGDVRYDSAGRSYIVVNAAREYGLVTNRHFGHHDLQLRPADQGLGVYTFAFESCQLGADR
ncbi:MAG: redoxin family protein [Candidatus Eremiobacteraeota bacterium]|nr:redoxin family protein [Candidatus Eremiobacteraeota bacterium]MBC5827776.1 redoxin family protein [Candidatus Eremiobacteraeota bacterium]